MKMKWNKWNKKMKMKSFTTRIPEILIKKKKTKKH